MVNKRMQEAKARKDRIDQLKEELKNMIVYERGVNDQFKELKEKNEKIKSDFQ